MAKNNLPASDYAQPHTMDGGPVNKHGRDVNPNTRSAKDVCPSTEAMTVSIGDSGNNNMNPYGVGEMRGYGAAIKGRKISGKMG
jgi:hypothetical protein